MAEFKFISSFGVEIESREILVGLYKMGEPECHAELSKIPTFQVLLTILYLDLCID